MAVYALFYSFLLLLIFGKDPKPTVKAVGTVAEWYGNREEDIYIKKVYLEDRPFLYISYQTLTSARLTLKVEEE